MYGFTLCLALIFTKGNNFCDFLFASLADIALPKPGYVLNEFAPKRANSFL